MSGPYILIFRSRTLKQYLDRTLSINGLNFTDKQFAFGEPYGVFSSLWTCKEYLNEWMSKSQIGSVLKALSETTDDIENLQRQIIFFVNDLDGKLFTFVSVKNLLSPKDDKFGVKNITKPAKTLYRNNPYLISITKYTFKVLNDKEEPDTDSKIYVAYLDKGCGNWMEGRCKERNDLYKN
uniref:Uncharacterized protein n=1 Tax=viral metagenome TaxID=1070528 RepID=A0A6C0CMQ1_9ZZZZ